MAHSQAIGKDLYIFQHIILALEGTVMCFDDDGVLWLYSSFQTSLGAMRT